MCMYLLQSPRVFVCSLFWRFFLYHSCTTLQWYGSLACRETMCLACVGHVLYPICLTSVVFIDNHAAWLDRIAVKKSRKR